MSLPLDRTAELLQSSAEHLVLVAVTMAIAASVGIPLGVWLHRHPRVGRWILGLTGVTQTIPSLALFGFLIPLHLAIGGVVLVGGIGPRTAIAVLVLYALLPVVRNTVTGLQSVDPRVREAGLAMGLTPSQLFWKVELPLAWKIILAGLRVATIATVGSATVAAAIDAGGLGKFIFRGLRMNDHGLILMGALPSAAIALLLDSLFGGLERLRIPTGSRLARPVRPAMRAAVPVLAALACFLGWRVGGFPGSPRQPVRVVVGAKDFTEQLLLGEWVAQTLEREPGLEVVRRFDLGGNLAHDALIAGDIDVYVEYTGTAWMAILREAYRPGASDMVARVRGAYRERFGIEVLEPLGFDDSFALLVRADTAKALPKRTFSAAIPQARGWRAAFGHDFLVRADGYPGLARTYGLQLAESPREMDLALTYQALVGGQVELIAGNATDGMISRFGLVQLEDDRHFFPPYEAVPVVRHDALRRVPRLRSLLEGLAGGLDRRTMRLLNDAVDHRHREPREVIREHLTAGRP